MIQSLQCLAGNQAITLNAETSPGTLVSGSAEVFAVDRATGERLNLFSIEPGEPILPIVNSADADWDLLAITLETSCMEAAGRAPEWAAIFALENWLAKIGSAYAGCCSTECRKSRERWNLNAPNGTLLLTAGTQPALRQSREPPKICPGLDSGAGLPGRRTGSKCPASARAAVALVPGIYLEACGEAEWTAFADGGAGALKMTLDLAIASVS